MKISLKSIFVVVLVLFFIDANAQQDFNMMDFSNKLNKVIAAKRQGFKPFLKAGSNEVDKSRFVELFKGGTNSVSGSAGKYFSAIEFETRQNISLKTFKECLKKAYLPNECLIEEDEGKANDKIFHLVVTEKADGYFNTAPDYYNLYTDENTDGGNHKVTFEISINSKEERETIFNNGSFTKQMQEIIADQKNAFASFKNGKDKKDTSGSAFLLKKKVWGAVQSELEDGINDDSTGMATYFANRFKFAMPAKDKFDYAFVHRVLQSIYPAGKYGFSMVDSSMEDGKLYYISFNVVQLFKDSFRLTNDRYFFDIVELEGQQKNIKRELSIKATLNHFTNKQDAGKISYWTGNSIVANDSLKRIITKLYGLAKQNKLGSLPFGLLKENERPIWSDFSFAGDARKLTQIGMNGYFFYIGNAGEFAVVKKLGKDDSKQSEEWMKFIQEVGIRLPGNFIYMPSFHGKFLQPFLKGKKNVLKVFPENIYLPFQETQHYTLYAENLMSATTTVAFETNEQEEITVYAIINFTAN
jgi:hypothetical protein